MHGRTLLQQFCFTVITLLVAHLTSIKNDEKFNFIVIYSSFYRWRYSEECTGDHVAIYTAHIICIYIYKGKVIPLQTPCDPEGG